MFKRDRFESAANKLNSIKQSIVHEISSKWDLAFTDPSTPEDEFKPGKENGSLSRKLKNRSVYGQPEVECDSSQLGGNWQSLDSLDNSDSVGPSLASSGNSTNDLRGFDLPSRALASDLGTSVESSDNEQDSEHKRCSSTNSSTSGCSIESQEEEGAKESKYFMKQFVHKIFVNSGAISLEEKAKFGYFARLESGRLWFSRYITKKRNENKCVHESTFYSLAQYFAIVLFECAESEDYTPAKSLMNMCFTYYHWWGPRSNSSPASKQYLYTALRDQPIWRLIRFWNAAFFDAVQCERVNYYQRSCHLNRFDDWQFHANVTFGQLGTFTFNMYSFGLPKSLCLEFLRKQSTIANLTDEQIEMLRDNIDSMYSCSTDVA